MLTSSWPEGDRPKSPKSPKIDRVVEMANTKVRVESVLTDHFRIPVPLEAKSWKTSCPLAYEHFDGGLDRQFRVYSESNRAWCFETHGAFDPVRLWQVRSLAPIGRRRAAESLLDAYGIEYRRKPYRVRWAEMMVPEAQAPHTDPEAVVQALQVFLGNHPAYRSRQLDPEVLRSVNYVLQQVRPVCDRAQSPEEVREWYEKAKGSLNRLLDSLSSKS